LVRTIKILVEKEEFTARLCDCATAEAVYSALPIEGKAILWGDEIYFSIPVAVKLESHAKEEVEIGDLAFWPPGNAFCIFFGPTPVSTTNKPRAAGLVNVFGKVEGDLVALKNISSGAHILVSKV
jgi:hypothetical protein